MIKIILFGYQGMLGNYIYKYLSKFNEYHIINIGRNQYDVSNDSISKLENILKEQVESSIVMYYVINCIGLIPQVYKIHEINDRAYIKINTLFPQILSQICIKLGFRMIHATTDCVFTGNNGNYRETDIHDECGIYGISKSMGEPEDCMVIRTSIIGEQMKNEYSLLEWCKSNRGGKIRGYNNHYWNGVTCLEFAKLVEYLIRNGVYWKGVRHIFSPDKVSKFDLLNMINNIYNLGIEIESYEDGNKIIDKTLNSIYDKIYDIKGLEVQIEELKMFEIL